MALTKQDKLDIKTIVSDVVVKAVKDFPTKTEVHEMIGEGVKDFPNSTEVREMIGDAVKDFPTRIDMHQLVDEAVDSLARDVSEGFHAIDARFERVELGLSAVEQNGLEVKFLLSDVVHRDEFLGLKTRVDHLEQHIQLEQ